jgi:Domain of unknown function (DUF4406)
MEMQKADLKDYADGPKLKVYLSGPISGCPEYNIPLFDHIADKLRNIGYEVFNPHDLSRKWYGDDLQDWKAMSPQEQRVAYRRLMAAQLHWIAMNADVMFMLPGWERSLGARAESELAIACEIQRREVPTVLLLHDRAKEYVIDTPAPVPT